MQQGTLDGSRRRVGETEEESEDERMVMRLHIARVEMIVKE